MNTNEYALGVWINQLGDNPWQAIGAFGSLAVIVGLILFLLWAWIYGRN